MDPSKAKVLLKLLSSKHMQRRGLRELKKRLLDSANIAVFRKLKLVPILLKIIEEHGSNCTQEVPGDACTSEGSSPHMLEDKDKLSVDSMDVKELEFEDLQRLKDLSHSSEAEQADTAFVSLAKFIKVDPSSEQILLYAVSLLCTMLQDHGAKQQCEVLDGVRIVMPFVTCKSLLIAERAVKATARMVELPGNNRDMFIRFKGPKLLLNLLLKPDFIDASFQHAILMAIRLVSCCGACCEAMLHHRGLETVCVVGLPSTSLQRTAVTIIATYSSLIQQQALVQLLDGTKELSLLLRVWQDNRDCAIIHSSTLRVLVNLVQLASRATEQQQHGSTRQTWLAGGGRSEESGSLGRDSDFGSNANLSALRLRLLRALFAIKIAIPLVTEIASYEEAVEEKIVSTLCTLCDGSLELKNSPSVRSNLALVWLQVVEAGGIKTFVRLLLKGDLDMDGSEEDEDTSSTTRLQKKILRAMLALENNHAIQEIVFKHCLASGILPALTVHFDAAFARYQNCRGPYTEGSLCTHQQAAFNISGKPRSDCYTEANNTSSVNAHNRQHSSSGLRRSLSACDTPRRQMNCSETRSLSPPLVHPLAPLSPPSSPQEAPIFVYTPYSPPHKKYTHSRSAGTSPNPPPQFYTSRSPSASPPHFPSYSPIKPGCTSPSFLGGWSSPSCSPSYSPSHSPSYTPPSHSSYSPSHSSYSPSHASSYSPSCSPTHLSSLGSPCAQQAKCLPQSPARSRAMTRGNHACRRPQSERESDDTHSRMKRNRCSSDDNSNEDSKKFKVIRIFSPDSAHANALPDGRINPSEIISTSKNIKERCLVEMVTEKLLQSDAQQSFLGTVSSSDVTSKSKGESSQIHEDNPLQGGVKYYKRFQSKICESEEASSQHALGSNDSGASFALAAQKAVHVRDMNHIKFRVGKRSRERRSTESRLKTSVKNNVTEITGDGRKGKCFPDRTKNDTGNQMPSVQASVAMEGIGINFDKSGRFSEFTVDLSITETRRNLDKSERSSTDVIARDQKEETVSSLEETISSMDVDESKSKDLPKHISKAHSQSAQSAGLAACEQRTNSVHVREFNHIKFRVGKRAKDGRGNAGQLLTGPCDALLEPGAREEELLRCSPKAKKSLVKKVSTADPVRVCESKLSSCELGSSAVTARAGGRQREGLEESLRHLELVVRIITQVCQIREALSGVCREFLPRVMLYLRHSHRLHPAASRFLSTISQTPCSIQGLLDTFFPAYVAVQLCESLIDVRKKRNSCACCSYCSLGVCGLSSNSGNSSDHINSNSAWTGLRKSGTNSCSSDDHGCSLEASFAGCNFVRTKQPEDHCEWMAESSKTAADCHKETLDKAKASHENGRCSSQGTSLCSECALLVKGGQSFLLNMSKFFGHVHRYGSQEAGNRLRPNAPTCVRETCSLNIPHIARCPSQLQQLMLSGGGLQDIFSVLREDGPASTVRYIYAAAALHALANAIDVSGHATLGKGCSLCLISAKAEGETDEVKDCTYKPRNPDVKPTEKTQKDHSSGGKKEKSRVSHGKCFWAEQVDHDVTLVCVADDDDLMQYQETWRQDDDEYSEEELSEDSLEDNESSASDNAVGASRYSKPGDELSSSKPNLCRDDTDVSDGVNASDKNACSERKCDGIRAHRSVLSEASEVWAVMLGEQGWREATDGVIRVGGLGLHTLTAIVHHLYGCTCAALSSLTSYEYVELLHACHMYGLKQLQAYAGHRIVQECISADDVLTLHHASVELVDKEVIRGALMRIVTSRRVPSWRRAQWLHTLAHSPPGEQLLNNIYSVLFHRLQASSNTCTCDASQCLYMTSHSVYSKLI